MFVLDKCILFEYNNSHAHDFISIPFVCVCCGPTLSDEKVSCFVSVFLLVVHPLLFTGCASTSMEMWLWRRMLRISWMEKRTDNSILQELEIKRELLGHVRKRKLTYYGHLCRDHGCQITKTVVEGYIEGRRRRGRPRKQYIDNIKQWTQLTTSQCVRAAEDRSRWKQLVSQAMVADDYT